MTTSGSTLIATITRPAVRLGVAASGVPVDVAGRVLGQRANRQWPPAVAVEGFQAAVLSTAGTLLRDEALKAEGRLLAEKLERLRAADSLEAAAELHLQRANADRQAQEEVSARHRAEAASTATANHEAAARRAKERTRAAREAASAAAEAAEVARVDAHKRIERQQRTARNAAIATERRGVAKEKAAATAARKAATADARIKASARARKT